MNTLRTSLFFLVIAVSGWIACTSGALAGAAALFIGAHALEPWNLSGRLCVTLTPTLILQRTIAAFAVRCPAVMLFSSDFSTERLKLNQQAIAHIRVRPTAASYDATTGYVNGNQETRDLLVDVPLTMDQHRHVTLKVDHLNAIADSKSALEDHFRDSAEVLGKGFVDYLLGKAITQNFSYESIYTAANSDKDALAAVRKAMNTRGVGPGRFGIVNSDVFETLDADARISNRYSGGNQLIEGQPLGMLKNVSGFETILEYPDLPTNNVAAKTVSAIEADDNVCTTSAAHGFVVGDRITFPTLTGGTGVTAGTTVYYVISIPTTTTFTFSATLGGSAVNVTVDATAGTVALTENMSGFFGTREAIAIKTGIPQDSISAAKAFGIPVPVADAIVTDPDSGLSMISYKWFAPGTMDAYVTLAFLYGAAAGKQAGSTAAGSLLDKAGHILRTA